MDVDFATAATLTEFLKRNPECKQNEIGKMARLRGRDVALLLKMMERARILKMTKTGKTSLICFAETSTE